MIHNKKRLKLLRTLGVVEIATISRRNLAGKRRFWKVVQHFLKKPHRLTTHKK